MYKRGRNIPAILNLFLSVVFLLLSFSAKAFTYEARYTADVKALLRYNDSSSREFNPNPTSILFFIFDEASSTEAIPIVDLLAWMEGAIDKDESPDEPFPPYNRRRDFGTWVYFDEEGCVDTRTLILKRDSREPVSYKKDNPCRVAKGLWKDPFSGKKYKTAQNLHIDHLVPLKEAYVDGAWRWTPSKRCHYANFLKNDFHLLAVSSLENLRKGDKAPDGYLPPALKYKCQYIKNWLMTKAIWELTLDPKEADGIRAALSDNGCNLADQIIPLVDLESQRTEANTPSEQCVRTAL